MSGIRASFFGHGDNRRISVARWMIGATADLDGEPCFGAALMLAQITWWTDRDQRTGKIRAEHEHGGQTWLVRPDHDWKAELGISLKAARRYRLRLVERGLIETRTLVDGGVRCTHLRRLFTADEPSTIVPGRDNANQGGGTMRTTPTGQSHAGASTSVLSGEVEETLSANADARAHDSLFASGPDSSSATGKAVAGAYPADFEAFYAAYPLRKAKKAGFAAWRKARVEATAEAILGAAERFAAECRQQRTAVKFIPHPASWLNAGRYADYDEDAGGPAEPWSRHGNWWEN